MPAVPKYSFGSRGEDQRWSTVPVWIRSTDIRSNQGRFQCPVLFELRTSSYSQRPHPRESKLSKNRSRGESAVRRAIDLSFLEFEIIEAKNQTIHRLDRLQSEIGNPAVVLRT